MEYRLLGTLEAAGDGRVLRFGSARQRTVIALMLLCANRVVPFDQFVDEIWDETPPRTARTQVQACISAIRQQLMAVGGGQVVETHAAGYAMRVLPDELDAATFDQLVSRGRAAALEGHIESAASDLRSALALWRGPAIAGVDGRTIHAAAVRLTESRLGALEERLDLELELGWHHRLVGELNELVEQHPLRERVRALHMLALYRSGRQAEALESFRLARQLFKDDLGLEPGAELRALEQAILTNDPALALGPEARYQTGWAKAASAVVPRQLPASTADFVGREELLNDLSAFLSAPGEARFVPVAILNGKGGVGKTALAVQVAHDLHQSFPDGTLFVQLREADGQPLDPFEVMAGFLRALGMAPAMVPADAAERAALYRSCLGDRQALIVLDDAATSSQVLPLLPGGPKCAVVITSRSLLSALPGTRHIEVGDLDDRASVAMLARIIGEDRVRSEEHSALVLARLCGYLPLALRIAGAKLGARPHWRIEQLVRRMSDEGGRLDELSHSGIGIRTTISISYDLLPDAARRLLRRLATLGTSDFPGWVCAPLLDEPVDSALDVLDVLVEARLLEVRLCKGASARFQLHELIRLYALERLVADEPASLRKAAVERVLGCWLSLATEAHRRVYGGDFYILHGTGRPWHLDRTVVDELLDRPLKWFRYEQACLVWAVLQARQADLGELCWELAITSVTLFESDNQVDLWRKTHEAALEATRRAGNQRGEAAVLYSLGTLAASESFGVAASYLERALRTFEEIGDIHGRGLTLAILAFVDRMSGDYDRGMLRYQGALSCCRAVGDLVGQVDALGNMAQIEAALHHYQAADTTFDQAFEISRSLAAPRVIAQTEHRFGDFLLRKGELDRAERSFSVVLQIAQHEGDVVGEAHALLGLGLVRTRQGRLGSAEISLRNALGLSERLGDNLVRGRILLGCAELHLVRDEPGAARSMIDDAIVFIRDTGQGTGWLGELVGLKAQLSEFHQPYERGVIEAILQLLRTREPASGGYPLGAPGLNPSAQPGTGQRDSR